MWRQYLRLSWQTLIFPVYSPVTFCLPSIRLFLTLRSSFGGVTLNWQRSGSFLLLKTLKKLPLKRWFTRTVNSWLNISSCMQQSYQRYYRRIGFNSSEETPYARAKYKLSLFIYLSTGCSLFCCLPLLRHSYQSYQVFSWIFWSPEKCFIAWNLFVYTSLMLDRKVVNFRIFIRE